MIDRFQLLYEYDGGDLGVWDSLTRNTNLTEEQIDLLYKTEGVDKDYLAKYSKLTDEQFMRFFNDEDYNDYLAQNPSINPDSEQVFTKGLFNWRW